MKSQTLTLFLILIFFKYGESFSETPSLSDVPSKIVRSQKESIEQQGTEDSTVSVDSYEKFLAEFISQRVIWKSVSKSEFCDVKIALSPKGKLDSWELVKECKDPLNSKSLIEYLSRKPNLPVPPKVLNLDLKKLTLRVFI